MQMNISIKQTYAKVHRVFGVFFFLLASSNYLISQVFVSGTVTSSDHEPLVSVLVIPEVGQPVYSDKNGDFKIPVQKGKCTLVLKFLGNEDLVIEKVINDEDVNLGKLIMTEKATLMNEVNISATTLPFKSSIAGTNYYISPLQLKKVQPISTEEVLKTLPGVNVLGDMGISNRLNVSIRGSWGRRSEKVLILEDGSPISPAPYTAPGVYYNPVSDRIDGIEVYTGPDVLRYGPNNMFGIINYITPKPSQQPALRAKITGGQRGYFTGLLSYGGTWQKVGTQVEAVYKRFDGFTQHSSVNMINLNAKVFAELAENQSILFKISGQFEDNQASLASLTPFSFNIDPTQNPLDADRFIMHRYGLDIIHKWVINPKSDLITKIFASDFYRDWWRQNNAVIQASKVREYVGNEIFSQRYAYLEGKSFGKDDYVRVGTLVNGRESTSDSKWAFNVTSLQETFKKSWEGNHINHHIEAQIKAYRETYNDQMLAADSSRWARSGRYTTDLAYDLQSISGYYRHQFDIKNWEFTPILRMEKVWMQREDRLSNAKNPDLTSADDLSRVNTYQVFQPGAAISYHWDNIKFFGSIYKGYIAPSKYFAFLVERDGVLVNPLTPEELSNIKPEKSVNLEVGMRGEILRSKLSGQMAIFNTRIRNFYLAGWNEFFDKLGVINLRGVEVALKWDVLPDESEHKFNIQPNVTFLHSKIISGELVDRHLFTQIKHTDATKQEFVDKVNSLPSAYDVYAKGSDGVIRQLTAPISVSDLDNITKTVYKFGEDGIRNGRTPYAPELAINVHLSYSFRNLGLGFTYSRVGQQYAEFANFENESGDGGIGKIKAYSTYDFNVDYDFNFHGVRCTLFGAAKNLGDQIFVASRLNRGQSGLMPGGFRQINGGINILL